MQSRVTALYFLLSVTACLVGPCFGFAAIPPCSKPSAIDPRGKARSLYHVNPLTALSMSENTDANDDVEETEPGQMRVSEIKAELELRGIDFSDCFDKESLVDRLSEARATGRASPDILEKFNKQKLEETFKEQKTELKDEDIQRAVANDGTLPGGMTPDMFKKLTSNPEIMELLQSTKMQEAMKLMMTGGQEEVERKVKDDPELQKTIEKLNTVLRSVQ